MTGTYSHSLKDSTNHNHGNVLCTGKDDGSNHEQSTAVPVPQNQAVSAKTGLEETTKQFLCHDRNAPQET